MTDDGSTHIMAPQTISLGDVPRAPAGSRQRTLPEGARVGPYAIVKHIATGGMADVYQVRHVSLQRHEAMKLPHAHTHNDDRFLRRFIREARLAANLQHPNIVSIFSVSDAFGGEDEGVEPATQSYFTMELIEGPDLDSFLETRGKLTLEEAVSLLRGIADALDYAHGRGVIHRDMKPSNILLRADDSSPVGYVPKVGDFGIARAAADDDSSDELDDVAARARFQRLTKAGAILGTPAYISPEQAGSGAPVTPATDQYALGIIAYQLLSGHTPFPFNRLAPMKVIVSHLSEPPPALSGIGASADVDDSINAVLSQALAKLPDQRFLNCRAFVDALDSAAQRARAVRPAREPSLSGRTLEFGPSRSASAGERSKTAGRSPAPARSRSGGGSAATMVVGAAFMMALGAVGGVVLRTLLAPGARPAAAADSVRAAVRPGSVAPAGEKADVRQATAVLKGIATDFAGLKLRAGENNLTPGQRRTSLAHLRAQANTALNDAQKALDLNHSDRQATVDHIAALLDLGRTDAARKEIDRALKSYPHNQDLLDDRSYVTKP
jgi:serine/threonine-protein kinase